MWAAFGDVSNYVEPFFGSGAVLLGRSTQPTTETVNDIDGYISNFWRAVQADPEAVAHYADWPVNEVDLHARHRWLVGATKHSKARIEAWRKKMKLDPLHYDAWIAGWWVWGICQWIGSGWCAAPEWWERAKEGKRYGDGRRPHLKGSQGVIGNNQSLENSHNWLRSGAGHNARGIHARGATGRRWPRGSQTAEHEQRPDLTSSRGVLSDNITIENEKRPSLWRGGVGVHKTSAEQFENTRPHLGPERGVQKRHRDLKNASEWGKRPRLGKGGAGVSRSDVVGEQIPQLSGDGSGSGRGVLSDKMFKADRGTASCLQATGIFDWMEALAVRLRRVRVCCGNWDRIVGPAVTTCIGLTGVFLDPPYSSTHRDPRIYSHDSMEVAVEVREWAIKNGDDPKLRIALCGYEGEHDMPESWQCVQWKAGGGYAASAGNHENAKRERIWFSPACLRLRRPSQTNLFKEGAA